jgi:hypothetical protein
MANELTPPPLKGGLPVVGTLAQWPQVWGNWITDVWQRIAYGWLWNTRTVTAAYTCVRTDSVILINGNITVTLPLIGQAGPKRITAKVINAGGGTRTVSGNGVNIDGAATWTTTVQYTAVDFVNDGAQWWTV